MARLQGTITFLLAVISALVGTAFACGYQTCPKSYDTSKLQLHIISHSHDDVGWLSTPDGYADNDVNPLLSHVVTALHKNPHRKFVEVEMYYFKRWWQRQTKATHDIVHGLVKRGQLAFANGGWCINDEASPLYNNIIDQMTLGIQFLRDTFGECAEPKLSWQIDPFGASREWANLVSQMGMDGLVLNRGNGHLHGEFLWNASRTHSVFTSRLHAHYSAPGGFNFEDRDHITDQNKHDKAKQLVEIGKRWNHDYGNKGHVLIPFGDDFRYKNAEGWFSNLDKLIEVVNKEHPDVHLQYSSPHCYIKAMHEAIKTKPVPVKSEDYFPLWTGYYSSRPQVKYLDRYANNLLQAAKQLEVVADLHDTQSLLWEGKNELAVLQHHDAVSGTSRPFVMFDYKERLVNAIHSVSRVISEGLAKLTRKSPTTSADSHTGPFVYTTANISDYVHHLDGEGFVAIVYNPLAQPTSTWLRLPVSGDHHAYTVHDQTGAELKSGAVSAVAISEKVKKLVGHHQQITHELVFEAKLPALGYTTYFVTKTNTKSTVENSKAVATNAAGDLVLKGRNFEAVVDHKSGQLKEISQSGKSHKVAQSWAYYPGRHSSAYEFCPSGGSVELSAGSKLVHAAQFEGFVEITVKVNEWIWQTIRVYADREYIELDQTIGPVADGDHISKEVITRFTTDLKNKGVFYTDANGRQDIERHRSTATHECGGQRNTIWYNYYPVSTATAIRDADDGHQLTVVTDRSVGAASEADGQLEVMLHRRLLEHKGLDIDMNDLDVDGQGVVARGRLFLFFSEKAQAADNLRQQNHAAIMQPITAFVLMSNIANYRAHHNTEWSALKTALPENVHLLTLENWGPVKNNEVLVRFENFYQPADVESKWSKSPAKVPMDAFITVHPESAEKTNLVVGGRTKVNLGDVEIGTSEIVTFVYKVKRTVEQKTCSLKWEKLAAGKKVPTGALVAGHEISNTPLYICRHKNVDQLPGKFNEGLHCHISYGGREMMFDDAEVEVLAAPAGAHYRWVPRHGGDPVPEDAFVGGHRAKDGVPIYIGRCHAHGVQVGKIDEYFYYPYGGQEHKGVFKDCINHEILTC